MYVEDSLNIVDQRWVDYNRKVVSFQAESVKDLKDEEIIENNGHDYAYHAQKKAHIVYWLYTVVKAESLTAFICVE